MAQIPETGRGFVHHHRQDDPFGGDDQSNIRRRTDDAAEELRLDQRNGPAGPERAATCGHARRRSLIRRSKSPTTSAKLHVKMSTPSASFCPSISATIGPPRANTGADPGAFRIICTVFSTDARVCTCGGREHHDVGTLNQGAVPQYRRTFHPPKHARQTPNAPFGQRSKCRPENVVHSPERRPKHFRDSEGQCYLLRHGRPKTANACRPMVTVAKLSSSRIQ